MYAMIYSFKESFWKKKPLNTTYCKCVIVCEYLTKNYIDIGIHYSELNKYHIFYAT